MKVLRIFRSAHPTRAVRRVERSALATDADPAMDAMDDVDAAIEHMRAMWHAATIKHSCSVWLTDADQLLPPPPDDPTGILSFRPRPPLAVGCYHPDEAHAGAHIHVSYEMTHEAIERGDLLLLDILSRSVYELAQILTVVRPRPATFTASLALPVRPVTAWHSGGNGYATQGMLAEAPEESACPTCRALTHADALVSMISHLRVWRRA